MWGSLAATVFKSKEAYQLGWGAVSPQPAIVLTLPYSSQGPRNKVSGRCKARHLTHHSHRDTRFVERFLMLQVFKNYVHNLAACSDF